MLDYGFHYFQDFDLTLSKIIGLYIGGTAITDIAAAVQFSIEDINDILDRYIPYFIEE